MKYFEKGERVRVSAYDGDIFEGIVVDHYLDTAVGDLQVEVLADGKDRSRSYGEDAVEPVEDPYEYNIDRTSLEHGTSSLQFHLWLDWGDAEEHLSGFIEAEEIHEEEAGFRFATYKLVKRRKAGKVQDV